MPALIILVIVGGAFAQPMDTDCSMMHPLGILVLSPSAISCQDKSTACTQIVNGLPAVLYGGLAGSRSPFCMADSTLTPNAEIKKIAVELCPKHCGFCCVTSENKCANAPNPRINCASITPAMCQSTQWREIIAQDCPSACGFCLLGGCIDAAPDCATQSTICGNPALASFAQTNCKRTCNLCNTAAVASIAVATGSTACGNTNVNCANWVRNGFCTSSFYTTAQKRQYCGASCGLCTGK